MKISSSDYASCIHTRSPTSAENIAKPDKSWRKLRLQMSIAPSHWDRQETGMAVVRLAHIVEEGRAPSLQWKDNNEGKGETSLPRNISPRFVSVKRDLSPCTLQRAELKWVGHCLRTLQCHSHTTLQEHAFSMGTVMKHLQTSSVTLPAPSAQTWHVTVTLPRRHKCQQLSTAWLATHLGNRLMALWYNFL